MLNKFPKLHLVAAAGIALVVSAGFAFSPARNAEANKTTTFFSEPASEPTATAAKLDTLTSTVQGHSDYQSHQASNTAEAVRSNEAKPEQWRAIKVKRGDTLTHVFARAGYTAKYLYKVLGDDQGNRALTRIYPGETLEFVDDGEGVPVKIRLKRNRLETFLVYRNDKGLYQSKTLRITPDIDIAYAEGKIRSSLFLAGKAAGLSESLTMQLASIFGWDIDFVQDIRVGDRFSLVYEALSLNGEKIGNGKILAASFTNRQKTHKAVLYKHQDGRESYYTPNGSSMKGAFLRNPIEFARISSHFSLRRKHPVLHKIRAHKGTDYAASRGTPIRATGDGKVIFAGRKGGYGKTVILRHGHKYTTLYAHMHKYGKGIRSGKRVKQGQVIGYVGSTGLATGSHLHYEFRVNGQHKNPVTVSLPKAGSIPRNEIGSFRSQTAKHLAKLDSLAKPSQLALNP